MSATFNNIISMGTGKYGCVCVHKTEIVSASRINEEFQWQQQHKEATGEKSSRAFAASHLFSLIFFLFSLIHFC